LPARKLEEIVEASIAEAAPAVAENFMKQLGSLGKAAGSTLKRATPGIVQGAATGASVGGPWGALIGAGAGLASSATSSGKPGAPAAARPAAPMPVTPTTLPTGQAAASTLASLFDNPIVRQMLLSQVLGTKGNQQVTAPSGASLPRGAINGLLMHLLANASEGLAEAAEIHDQDYLKGESGEYLVDPASPEQQAAAVLAHLEAAVPAAELQYGAGEFLEAAEWINEDLEDWESEEWLEAEETAEMAHFY
jgi:hypothetical protein